jgi:hypothetical protein
MISGNFLRAAQPDCFCLAWSDFPTGGGAPGLSSLSLSATLSVPLPLAVSVEQREQNKLLEYDSNGWDNILRCLLLINLAELKEWAINRKSACV